jgi:hypothetical protein
LDTDEKLCCCFTDRQKASGRVNWTKLTHVLRRADIDWRQRRMINKLNRDQSVKARLDQGETTSVKNGRGVDKEVVCHRYYSTCTVNNLTKVWRPQNWRTSNSHHEICGWPVLMAKTDTMLQGRIERPNEIGRCYIMETEVEETKAMRIWMLPSPAQMMTKTTECGIYQ